MLEEEIYTKLVSTRAIGLAINADPSPIRLHCADKSARSSDVMAVLCRLYDRDGNVTEFIPRVALPSGFYIPLAQCALILDAF